MSMQIYGNSLKMKVLLLHSVENVLTKVEISRFEQFLLLSRCFQTLSAAVASERVCMRKMRCLIHVYFRKGVKRQNIFIE